MSLIVYSRADTFAFDAAKQAQWQAFLRKSRLQPTELPQLVGRLRAGLARLSAG